jgi:hypothetical protein
MTRMTRIIADQQIKMAYQIAETLEAKMERG